MNFTVVYRDPQTGVQGSLILDVPRREDVVPTLKERGLTVLSVTENKNCKRKPILKRLFCVGVILVVIGCSTILLLNQKSGQDEPTVQNKSKVGKQMAKAVPVQKNTAKTNAAITQAAVPVKTINPPQEIPQCNPRLAPTTTNKYPRRVVARRPEPPQRFKYESDNLIAGFLEIVPGTPMEGGLRFDKIGRDFEKSLLEDVAFAEGQDTDANQELRAWVRETKKEIQDVMAREHKTFAQVMEEQFNQLIALGQYKRNLEAELREIRKSGEYTGDEYDKFIVAANKMLEAKGASPLKVPRATYYQLELYKQRRAAREAQGQPSNTNQ